MSGRILPVLPENLPSKKIPVFVVDDSQDNLDLMEALLQDEGYETIHKASSGPKALEFLETRHDIGVILLDMMMPGMDGYEVCRRVTSSDAWRHIPVIMVTGGALRHNEALQKSFAAGATDFITKPVNEVDLFMRVNSALALYRERVIRHHKARELAESEEKFRATFDQAPVGIAHVDLRGRLLLINRRLCELLGYSSNELTNLPFDALCDSRYIRDYAKQLRQLLEDGIEYHACEIPLLHKSGDSIWTRLTLSLLRNQDRSPKTFIYLIEDITRRKMYEDDLRLAATVFDGSTEAIIVTDSNARILKVNSAFTSMTGYTTSELAGENPRILQSGMQDGEFYRSLWTNLNETGQWQGEIWNRRKDGDIFPAWLTICAVRNGKGHVTNYVGISRDITLRKEAEERLNFQATHDALTGLPNRTLFHDRLTQALALAAQTGTSLALLFLDLDRFKVINDTLGHGIGDRLLQAVVERLRSCAGESDTLARWGGDEFIFLLERVQGTQHAATAARRILDSLIEPFHIQGHEVFVTGTIGISLFPGDGHDVQALLGNADTAMYRAKQKGKNDYQFYAAAMNATAYERLKLESDLRHALKRNELVLHYQPRVDIHTGEIIAVEALLRWQHPVRGLLCPKDFIGLAEESGLIVPMGEWVMHSACMQNKAWQAAGLPPLRVSVNLSTHQFKKENLTETVEGMLKKTGTDPGLLELEITESVMMENVERAVRTLNELSMLGVNVSIDDFGTGYSSLGYLKRFPIGAIKLDQSFVQHIPVSPDDSAIAMSIISLGRALKLRVVAEGVETQEQLSFLRDHGCHEAQGFLFGYPAHADEITKTLQKPHRPEINRFFRNHRELKHC